MIWIISVFLPMIAAFACLMVRDRIWIIRILLPVSPLPALFLVLTGDVFDTYQLDNLLLAAMFGFGPFERTFLLITVLSWAGSSVYASLNPRSVSRIRPFAAMFLLTMCGNIGLVISRDVVSFYFFFALMTFSAYALVVHTQKDHAMRAGRVYLIMAVLGEGLLIAGLMLAVFAGSSHSFKDIVPALALLPESHPVFWTLFAGFGIKAGMVFLHFWLPMAHPVAPAPASAVLSGSMIKAGLLGWLNFFPAGDASLHFWGNAFIILGLLGTFYGALAGLREKGPKTILAYSSISQIGLIAFVLGLGLVDKANWTLAGPILCLLVVNHALSKSSLFLGSDLAPILSAHRFMAIIMAILLAIPALILAGAPLTGGSQAKYLLKAAAEAAPHAGVFAVLLPMSSLLTSMLMTSFIVQAFSKNNPGKAINPGFHAWAIMTAMLLLLPLLYFRLYPETGINLADKAVLFSSLWPVIAGTAVYFLAARFIQSLLGILLRPLPDMASVLERLWHQLNSRIRYSNILESELLGMNFARLIERIFKGESATATSRRLENQTSQWTAFGVLFMVVILVFSFIGLMGD